MKITIITVCYNSQSTINKTIESVLSQTYKDIEYIIIDGKSTDNTLEIINSYKSGISKLVSEKDKGLYDALNKGLSFATGDIIGFLHSDDVLANNLTISLVVDALKSKDVDVVWGDLTIHDPANGEIIRYYSGGKFKLKKFYNGLMPPHPTIYAKKQIYDSIGNFSLKFEIASDYHLILRMLVLFRAKFKYIPKVLVRMTAGGLSNKNIINIIKLNYEIAKAHWDLSIYISPFFIFKKIPFRILEMFANDK